jgi:hypothetical protein
MTNEDREQKIKELEERLSHLEHAVLGKHGSGQGKESGTPDHESRLRRLQEEVGLKRAHATSK